MTDPSSHEVTQLLQAWSDGNREALDELVPLGYEELHRLARHYIRGERPGHSLQTSDLFNEAYVRLIDWKKVRWQNRALFPECGFVRNKDKAFEDLEQSLQRHESWMTLLKVEPGLDSLRDDPRFDALVKRVGLI